jgi:hypothetical protein
VLSFSLSLSLSLPEGWVETREYNCQLNKRDRGESGLDSMNLQTNGTLPLVLFLPPSVPLICFHRYLNQEYSEESAKTGLDSMNVAKENNNNNSNKGWKYLKEKEEL